MPKLSELTSITALTPDDEFVVTNDPLGTPATRRITRANVSKSMSGVYNVMDYGATADGTTDDSAAFQAAIDAMDTDKGGTLLVPAGRYYMASGVDLNNFTGSDCTLAVIMWGAELWTNQAISIFYANVADNTEANIKIGRILTFWGGVLNGGSTVGSKGIDLDAMYNGGISYTHFRNLDVGLELSFCLNTQVSFCRGTNNLTYDFVAQTGVGKWTGAGYNTSQSNQTTFYGCRSFGGAGMTAMYYISAASGVQIVDGIVEGGDPVNCIEFDAETATTVKDFRVINLHNECTPTNAMIKYDGAGGYFLLDGLYLSNSVPYVIDVTGSAQCTYKFDGIAYNSWTTAFMKGTPANGSSIHFGPSYNLHNAYDVSDDTSTDIFGDGYPTASSVVGYDGQTIRSRSLIVGSPAYATTANPWLQVRGSVMPIADNDTKCSLGAGNRQWRSLYVGTGTCSINTNIDLNGNSLQAACLQSAPATSIADIANVLNTTEKAVGRVVWDTTNNRLMIASGGLAASPWYVADGSTSVTPS